VAKVFSGIAPVPIADTSNAYGQRRLSAAVSFLEKTRLVCFKTSGQHPPRRDAMFGIAAHLVRSLRMPVELAADCIEVIYNERLIKAGMAPWSRTRPGDYGMSIVERLEHARDTSSEIPPGSILSESEWTSLQTSAFRDSI
jgi:hypothetical protein